MMSERSAQVETWFMSKLLLLNCLTWNKEQVRVEFKFNNASKVIYYYIICHLLALFWGTSEQKTLNKIKVKQKLQKNKDNYPPAGP